MKKKIFIILLLLIIGIAGLFGFKYFKGKIQQNKTINSFVESAKANGETYLILEINPKLMLILDENNKVKDISQLNDDASIFKNEEFENLNLDEAISKVITVAKENNYLTENKVISISTLTENDECIKQVKSYILGNDSSINVNEINKSKEELYDEIVKVNEEKLKEFEEEYNQNANATEEYAKEFLISTLKSMEKSYVDKLNEFKKQGYTYDEEMTKKNGNGESIWYSRIISQYFEDDGEYADVKESNPIYIPVCDVKTYGKEMCKEYCPHCELRSE